MANRDQNWGFGGREGGERRHWGEDHRGGGRGPERRAFSDDREGGEPWRGQARYGARYDQDRAGYGGQEYGMEGGRGHETGQSSGQSSGQTSGQRTTSEADRGWRGDERETWNPGNGEPYGDLELNPRNRGIEEFGAPHDYAYHPKAGHEFDPDYLHWREEQMRSHDRDYHEWRSSQQQRYDEDYKKFRTERREHFGRRFDDWRNQRNATGGVADTSVQPGVSEYGGKVGMPSGYDAGASGKPSGMIESPTSLNASPGAAQTGGSGGGGGGGGQAKAGGSGDSSPEFGREPSQVQSAADGHRQGEAKSDPKGDADKR